MLEYFQRGEWLLGEWFTRKLNALVERARERVVGIDPIFVDYKPGEGYSIGMTRSSVGEAEAGDTSACYKVVSVANDYLVCHAWDGETEGEDDVLVAKPWMLRHDVTRYPWLATLTTVDAQTVDIETADEVEAQWKVACAYSAGDVIQAVQRVTELTVTIGEDEVEITLMDMNHDARAWCEVVPEEV